MHVRLGQWVKRRIKGKGAVDRVGWNNEEDGVRGKLTDRVEVEGKVRDVRGDRVAIDSRDLTLLLHPNLSTDSFLNKGVNRASEHT